MKYIYICIYIYVYIYISIYPVGGLEQLWLETLPALRGAAQANRSSVCFHLAMSMTEWDKVVSSQHLFVPNWKSTERGTVVSVVVDCLVHTESLVVGFTVPDSQKVRLYGEINQQVRGCRRLTVLDAVLDFSVDTVDLLVTDSTTIVAHGLSPAPDLFRVLELCAGVSCSSVGLSAAGFHHIGSVEWRPKLAQLHETCHPGVPVITGDITDPGCIRAILQKFQPPFSLMSGISCQPYSSGGSQGGSDDIRSSTLPATVRIAYLCQSPVLIIECVTQARSNRFVKSILQALEMQLGYHLSEVSLKLEDNWASRRFRWWVVASHPTLGPIQLPEWPKSPGLCIRDLMPYNRLWSAEILQELQLTAAEERLFTVDRSSLRKYVMQSESKLPTCLHSWGSQAGECPCGCRQAGFSEGLVKQRGIYAQLIPVVLDDGSTTFRHLHPCELALLNAMPPPSQWFLPEHPDLRLCLGAIGQLASPLQAAWVGSCVVKQLHVILDLPEVNPKNVLQEFKNKMFACAKDMFPSLASAASVPSVSQSWVQLIHADGTSVHIQVGPSTTFAELCQAELALTQQSLVGTWCDVETSQPFDVDDCIAGKCIRVVPEVPQTVPDVELEAEHMQVEHSPVAPEPSKSSTWFRKTPCPDGSCGGLSRFVPDSMPGLTQLSASQLAGLLPPLVTDVTYCEVLRQSLVHGPARLQVLANEDSAMADDELTLHLKACLRLAGRDDVQMLDPLLALGWLRAGDVSKVSAWIQQFPNLTKIVSAVLVNEHWIPVVWSVGLSDVQVTLWEHTDTDVDCLCPLHGLISSAWGRPMFSVACTRRTFGRNCCGAACVAFLASKLLHKDLPRSDEELVDLHHDLRCSFAAALHDVECVPKPWCWGFGNVDVPALTQALLQTHGVPAAQAQLRSKLVIQTLGRSEVQKALQGIAPWKSLKALANLQSPPLQLVLPDELHQQNAHKNAPKSKRAGAAQKLLPSKPADLDPAKLVIAPESFKAGTDEPIGQLPFASVGPLATGLALATLQEAQQFLSAGQLLTSQGLALLIVNPPTDLQTNLQWSSIRFAARCSMNHEPMLLPGLLV